MADMSIGGSIGGSGAFGARGSRAVAYAGGVVSLALIAGITVWGVKLVLRDVNGIPVVQSVQGDVRVRPEDPGGTIADHEGLSVNEVVSGGVAAPVAERVRLAPQEPGLTAEDLSVTPTGPKMQPASSLMSEPVSADDPLAGGLVSASELSTAPQTTDDVLAMLAQVSADSGAAPLAPLEQDETGLVTVTVNGQPVATRRDPLPAGVIPASVPGVIRAPRPPARPAGLQHSATAQAADPVAAALASQVAASDTSVQITPDGAFPAGTHLAQLSAPDSPEAALREWDRLVGMLPDYFHGRQRVIQKIERDDGRTFYRLRAQGFEGESDVRRFCSAIEAASRGQGQAQGCWHVEIR